MKIVVGLILFAVAGFFGWQYLSVTEEDRVKEVLETFANSAEIKSSETPIQIAQKSKAMKTLFTPEIELQYQGMGSPKVFFENRDELVEKSLIARRFFTSLSLSYSDLEIEILNENEAKAAFVGEISGLNQRGESVQEASSFIVELVKPESDWLIYRLSNQEAVNFR